VCAKLSHRFDANHATCGRHHAEPTGARIALCALMSKILTDGRRGAVALCAFALVHCSGKAEVSVPAGASGSTSEAGTGNTGANAGSSGSLGTGGSSAIAGSGGAAQAGTGGLSTCGTPRSKPVGRPKPVACSATTPFDAPEAAGGAASCGSDADCAAGAPNTACLRGQCAFDECLDDADCATGQICMCSTEQRGNAEHRNLCLTVTCRVDADCGPAGTCSPSYDAYCGGLTGYYCHSSADTCHADSDCCDSTPICEYEPTLGHFACAAATVCAG